MKILNSILFGGVLLLHCYAYAQAQEKPLSLRDAQLCALKSNKEIHIQRIEVKKAEAAVSEAKSNLRPSVSLHGSYQYFMDRPVIFMPGAFADQPHQAVVDVEVGGRHAFNSFLSVFQPLYMNGSRNKVSSAATAEKMVIEQTQAQEQELLYDLSQQYFATLLLQEQLRLLQQSLDRNLKALADSRALYAQGRAYKTDTLRNYIGTENLKTSIFALETATENAMANLKRLVGLDLNATLVLTDSLSGNISQEVQPAEIKEALSLALANRSEVKIQRLQLLKGQQELSQIRAERAPKVWLSGQYQLQAQADELRLSRMNFPATSFVGAHVAVPLYTGNRMQAKANQARLSLQQQEIALTDLEQKLENELHALINGLQEAQNRLAIQQKTVEVALLNFKMSEERYRHGLGSRLELTDAELALTQAKTHQLQALYQVKTLQMGLKLALGILHPIADASLQEKP